MTAESVRGLLAQLTGATGETAEQVYAHYANLSLRENDSQEQLVRRALASPGKASQIRESLLGTIKAGGGQGESAEECLRNTGLQGWS